jgi:hypothetical protein
VRKYRWVRCIAGRSRKLVRNAGLSGNQILGALVTLPDRMHRVQTFTYFGLPSTIARTR